MRQATDSLETYLAKNELENSSKIEKENNEENRNAAPGRCG